MRENVKATDQSAPPTSVVPQTDSKALYGPFLEPYAAKLEALDSKPRRHPLFHWSAIALSVISLAILIIAMVQFPVPTERLQDAIPMPLKLFDIGLGVFFAVEFFTRSGFRWDPVGYARTHFFDFVAMAPAILLFHHGIPTEGLWIWLVLIGAQHVS